MRFSKPILAAALLLSFAAAGASAEPATAPSETLPAVEAAAPADLFGASVLSAGDCGDKAAKRSVGGDPYLTCGQCSHNPCKGASVGDFCGLVGTSSKTCVDYFIGTMCLEGDGVHCRCAFGTP